MMVQSSWKRLVLWAAVVSFCIPTPVALAGDSQASGSPSGEKQVAATAGAAIADVAMAPGGVVVGRVVDAQGRAMAGAVVVIRRADVDVARTVADRTGAFVVRGLPGGIYQVIADRGVRVCRLWAANTAPPAAKTGVLIVSDPNAVLGQWEPGTFGAFLEEAKYTLTNPLVVGGIIALAVGIPVAINNSSSKDKKTGS